MNDIKTIQKEVDTAKAKLAKLSEELKLAETAQLLALPEQLGIRNIDLLIKALIPHASPVFRGKLKAATHENGTHTSLVQVKSVRRKRARIDGTAKEAIKVALRAKDKTAAQVAKDFSVSIATVNNIKKDAGLTRKRK